MCPGRQAIRDLSGTDCLTSELAVMMVKQPPLNDSIRKQNKAELITSHSVWLTISVRSAHTLGTHSSGHRRREL